MCHMYTCAFFDENTTKHAGFVATFYYWSYNSNNPESIKPIVGNLLHTPADGKLSGGGQ